MSIENVGSIEVSARPKPWVCGGQLAGITVSNAAGDVHVCVLWVFYVIRQRSLSRADHSSRGVLASMSWLTVIKHPRQGRTWPTRGCRAMENNIYRMYSFFDGFQFRRQPCVCSFTGYIVCSLISRAFPSWNNRLTLSSLSNSVTNDI